MDTLSNAAAAALYLNGSSTTQIAASLGVSVSTARKMVIDAGLKLRPRGALSSKGRESIVAAGRARRGAKRSAEACSNIQQGRAAWGEKNAVGVSLKSNGYLEYTRGPNKGRAVHVVAMEERIGRRLLADEVVHHIDGDTSNNNINNLALMTRSGHTRLHRREQRIGGQ